MKLSELLGTRVVTTEGKKLGRVHDVQLIQDGSRRALGASGFRLHALAVGKRAYGTRLGYVQRTVEGPWLLHHLLTGAPTMVPWSAIVDRDDERIVVDAERITTA